MRWPLDVVQGERGVTSRLGRPARVPGTRRARRSGESVRLTPQSGERWTVLSVGAYWRGGAYALQRFAGFCKVTPYKYRILKACRPTNPLPSTIETRRAGESSPALAVSASGPAAGPGEGS